MPNDEQIDPPENEAQELLDTVIPDGEKPEVVVPEKPREPLQAVQSLTSKERAEERKRDREAGRASVLDTLNKQAQAKGFDSLEEMLKAAPGAAPKPKPMDKSAADAELRAENAQLKKTVQGLRSRISVLENDLALRQMAYEADVQGDDIDYALSALNTHYRKLSDDEAKAFNPQKFLAEDLKAKKPGIFRQALEAKKAVEETPVSSSPLSGKPPTSNSKPVIPAEGENRKHAREMTKAEFQERLRQMGQRDPASMV